MMPSPVGSDRMVHREYVTTAPTTSGYVVHPHVTHVVEPRVTYVQEPRTTIEYVPQVTYVAQERTYYETVPKTSYETMSYTTYDVQPIQQQQTVLIEQEVPVYYQTATEQTVYGQTTYAHAASPVSYAPQVAPVQCTQAPIAQYQYAQAASPAHCVSYTPTVSSCCPTTPRLAQCNSFQSPALHYSGSSSSQCFGCKAYPAQCSGSYTSSQYYPKGGVTAPPRSSSFTCTQQTQKL